MSAFLSGSARKSRLAVWSFALCAFWGCGGNQPISSETSKFEVADESAAASENKSTESDEDTASSHPEGETDERKRQVTQAVPATEEDRDSTSSEVAPEVRPSKMATGVYKPPKGPPAAQRRFIQQILEAQITGNSVQSQKIDFEDKRNAAVASCDLILSEPKATSEEKQFAIMTKFRVLTEMAGRLQDDSYAQKAMDFAAQLQAKEKGSVENELGVAIGVSLLPQQFAMVQKPTDEDVQKLVEGYLTYLAEGPLPPMYQPGLQIAKMLSQLEKTTKAIEVIEAMLTSFAKAEDLPEKTQAVAELNRMLRLYQADFPTKLQAALADEKAFPALEETFDAILKDEGTQTEWLQFIYGIGATLEREGKTDAATRVFSRVAKLSENAKDAKAAEMVKRLLANAEARKNLIGKTFDFTATDGNQAEFKLSSLKGKPVVVLFWTALDRGASFNELENIQQTLLATRSAFEVVLVNVDDKPEIFKQFSEIQKVTWAAASVRCPDASKEGMESDLEKQIGLDQLPFSLLLDGEGKASANFAQGSQLESLMQALLKQEQVGKQKEETTGDEKKSEKSEGASPKGEKQKEEG
jgi:tetratricopeptide (TPR) repeat protein